ncbi:MAG: TRAP transporter substrate-binding protein [Pseudomonadota bacterium]|nr:TRAP transporter substrate-binding protein [Pseudomonadota bacterium]
MSCISRRALVGGALAALPLPAVLTRPAGAAEFSFKLGNNMPLTHPMNVHAAAASARIREATGGRVEVQIFPSSQLGSDTDMLSQIRSGAIELFCCSGLILATLVPVASINGIGFAFKDYPQVWAAMDGKLGALVRADVAKRGIIAMERIWDNGFRNVTNSVKPIVKPEDLSGMRIRVPVSPLWTSMFLALGASPASINFNEVYSALQTHIVDAQENPMVVIDTAKLYEVQKYLSRTKHMWDGYWVLANARALDRLKPEDRDIVVREINRSALDQRAAAEKLNNDLGKTLEGLGMQVNDVDPAPFREKLIAAGFYKGWQAKYGDAAWSLLAEASGGGLP